MQEMQDLVRLVLLEAKKDRFYQIKLKEVD